jgi:hypothetical protein
MLRKMQKFKNFTRNNHKIKVLYQTSISNILGKLRKKEYQK